jgi:ABC-type sugar transport system ATPase subunit
LTIKPGEKVGLVGRSGAGKSTLVNLLLRFYDLESGRILIDGQDIADVTQESLRAAIGMVTQDTSLLHRSIAANIRYGRPRASAEDVQTAFIAETLSSAQRRRVAMHHQPLYSTCTTHGSNVELRDLWAPLFEDGDVALVLAGHNHIYERSVPIKAGQERPPGEGTVYLVSGGAGAPLYPNSEAEWFGAVANPIEHYVIADFLDDRIELVARDLSGNIIDQVTIPR